MKTRIGIGIGLGALGLMSLALAAGGGGEPTPQDLKSLATQSLHHNIVTLPTGSYMSAGDHQFRSFWTRDFCFASKGLILSGRSDVVRDHLTRLLSMLEPKQTLLPRYMDHLSIVQRYVLLALGKTPAVQEPLVPNYWSGGNSPDPVIDSNALFLMAALNYLEGTGDTTWWGVHEDEFVKIYRFYERFMDDGLIKQGRASDWQDSATRSGKAFFTNLIFWSVSKRLQSFPRFEIAADYPDQLKQKMIDTFYDPQTGLYFSMENEPQISLEGLLFAITWGFHSAESPAGAALYSSLKKHPLWQGKAGIPGFATFPDYPESAIEPMPRLTGMKNYHDQIYWSWLIALSAKVAFEMNDTLEGNRILARLQQVAERDGAVGEVYWPESKLPKVQTLLYRSEIPFSWGSAITLEAIAAQSKK